jgi:hypothetical protein
MAYKFHTKFKNGMTTDSWNALKPKRTKEYDEERAKEYMHVMTGKTFNSVTWDTCAAGIKRVRYVLITEIDYKEWDRKTKTYRKEILEKIEIPHWDFNPEIKDISNAC